MKKFITLLDNNILRWLIAFSIFFVPLYPKLPSISISHVWVYIRLEDFLILLITVVWFIQLIRKKVTLPKPEGNALFAYWIAGLVSLIYCLLFVAPHLQNFFPKIAALEFFRRIEYMILFFAAFSSVEKKSDIILYLTTLAITLALVTVYGFGQRFYLIMYTIAPAFFKLHPFCFPAFLTGNEEFAKGTPLCLDALSRITSTFGGQYDLAAFVVFTVPIFIALFIVIRKWYLRVILALLIFFALEVLNFTSSRTSFGAYIIGIITMLIVWKKKWWLIPVLFVSIGSLFVISNSTLARYEKTIQPVQEVQIQPGTDAELLKKISKTTEKVSNSHPQTVQPGTVIVGNNAVLPNTNATQVLTDADLQALSQQNINISSDSGAFLLRKAYALDISFTTRFQAEWPRDWKAFLGSPLFGTGYSSLTLASDNDYLRALGETGLAGTMTFLLIFVVLGIFMRKVVPFIKDPITTAFLFGLVGGVVGLLVNAALIDVFEASKVAEPLWILLGIGVGAAKLYQTEKIDYKKEILNFFTSSAMIMLYMLLIVFIVFISSVSNFFVADDFTWLHWAAIAHPSDLAKYFIQAGDFFYRPLDKIIVYGLYMIFSFQPEGYHWFILFLHYVTAIGVFFLAKKLSGNKLISALATLLFLLHPIHTENIYWFSGLSNDLSSCAIIFMMLTYIKFREKKSITAYIVSIIFSAVAFASYEIAVTIPFILIALDVMILKPKKQARGYLWYIPFFLLLIFYFVIRLMSHSFFGGGDYSYHMSRILPNIVGNYFGYIGVFLGGLPFLAFYNYLRSGLRNEWIYFSIVAVLIIAYFGWMFVSYREKVTNLLHHKDTQLLFFCLVFAFITLLPFLPLGNIAPRYLYLTSAGFSLALVIVLRILFSKVIKEPRYVTVALILVTFALSYIYYVSNLREQYNWQQSGVITKNSLLFFRRNYPSFASTTDVYFVNTPIMNNNTWVFPVGLSDGLWFIYREKTPKVQQVGTSNDAKRSISASGNQDSYIFQFDEKGTIKEVK